MLPLAALALALVAAPLAGQESPRQIERTAPPRGFVRIGPLLSRPMLGVVVDMRAGASDSIGARIESVTPGGPADRAGVRSGDIITRIGGRLLVSYPGAPGGGGTQQSQPALRLIEHSVRLAPNDTVALQLRRGNNLRNVRLVTEPQRAMTYWRSPAPGDPEQGLVEMRQRLEQMQTAQAEHSTVPDPFYTFLSSPLASLQLAPLNAELGEYFGVSDGILVISVPRSSGLGLRGGDVILRVDGRAPASPSHLLRILQSYSMDEEVRLDIVRNRKRETVEGSLATRR
jgi:hypothetical protein